MGSSKFSSPFFKKSPLLGAYASGADGMVTVSDAPHYAKLQSDITNATLKSMEPKASKCDSLRNNWHAGKMTDKAYADASKDCSETKSKSSKTEQEKGVEKFGQDSYVYNKMQDIGELATATLENELKNK